MVQIEKTNSLEEVKSLYLSAFPEFERKPFDFLLQRQNDQCAEIFSITYEGTFCGLAIFLYHEDLVLLNYFAISKEFRGRNIGSIAISKILKYYRNKSLVLEIESIDVLSKDIKTRLRREEFYLRNGFKHLDVQVILNGAQFMLMGNQEKIEIKDYLALYRNVISHSFVNDKIQVL